MKATLLLLFTIICISNASDDLHCYWKHNITSGLNNDKITTCELRGLRYNLMSKPVKINLTSSENEIKENIRVRFLESDIQSIPSSIFTQLDKIEMLELNNVGLRNIIQKSFDNAANLKVLDIHGNSLQQLGAFSFREAENLEILDLSSNMISNINYEAFTGLSKLVRLSLSNNKISIIDEETFQPLKSLTWIWLDRNEIKIISMNHLVTNQKLTGIYLNNNKISALSTVLFDHLPELNYLFLSGNNCTSQNFVSQKIQRNSNVKKELALCFKEFRTIVLDEEEKHQINNVLTEAENVHSKCEDEKNELLKKIENSRKAIENKGN